MEVVKINKLLLKDKKVTKVLIAEKGYTLRTYSKVIGISHPYLSQVLNGKRNPSATTAHKIASGLGLKVDDLFNIKNSPRNNMEEVF